ncbi:MAG: class II glutamine amidotransferase [Sneathiellales bacterium]|nr:class II glutamine amidotransferase [Sneathiellales bacterium]
MCRWLAYIGPPRVIEDLVYEGDHSLSAQAMNSNKAKLGVHGDGGGLGWYSRSPEPGLYRNPGPAWSDPNLRELTRHVESHIFFAHVRASTGAPNVFVNCHPFRDGKWLFMHNGQIGGFPYLKRGLHELLSHESYHALEGSTDSELLFQLMITNGLKTDPVQALRSTVQQVENTRKSNDITEAFRATFAITNGESLWALRWSSDELAPSLFQMGEENSALVVSEPLDEDISNWKEIPPNSLLFFERQPDQSLKEQHQSFL